MCYNDRRYAQVIAHLVPQTIKLDSRPFFFFKSSIKLGLITNENGKAGIVY